MPLFPHPGAVRRRPTLMRAADALATPGADDHRLHCPDRRRLVDHHGLWPVGAAAAATACVACFATALAPGLSSYAVTSPC
ncbi:hypothetical protein [Streptomyces sp. NPDC088254]|uniref:hypothetical protein n=1 Tax=Streptomyces sp. NPDC088254 TaxID=3365847 RepID=UPI003810376D